MNIYPPYRFLRVDEAVQRIIFIMALFFAVLFIINPLFLGVSFLLAIPFGSWQVISGIIGTTYNSRWRIVYLLMVAIYFIVFFTAPFDDNNIWDAFFIGFRFFGAIGLGIYYYVKTRQEKQKTGIGKNDNREEYMDILDTDLDII